MEVFDNFLNRTDFINIKNAIESKSFPWYATGIIEDYQDVTCDEKYNIQMTHVMYLNYGPISEYIQLLDPVFTKLRPKAILKVKANMNFSTNEIIEHGYHVDFDFPCKTAVFYLNTNNGYTKFEDGEKISSLENRMVIFDSLNKHTGSTCTDKKYRIVLNINYID